MAADNKARQKLVQFINRKMLDPVLRTSDKRFSESERKVLERLKKKTETQKERYANYKTAAEVRQQFQGDLTSQPAKRVHADLRKLNLPAQPDFKDDFLALADRLNVTKGERTHRKHRPHPPHPWHKKKPEDREKAWRELHALARKGDRPAKRTLEEHSGAKRHTTAKKRPPGASAQSRSRSKSASKSASHRRRS